MWELISLIWQTIIIQPMTNLLLLIYDLLGHGPHMFGLAIILFTIVIKLLTWPLNASQVKGAQAMQELQNDKEWQDIQKKYANPLSVKFLAEYCCVGERTLLRNFVSTTGYTPMEYIQQVRIQKSRELLETTTRRIEQIALQVGYEDSGAFRKLFKKFTGLSPKEFRLRFVA